MKDKLKMMEEKMTSSNIYLIVVPEGENRGEVAFKEIMVDIFLYIKKNEPLK